MSKRLKQELARFRPGCKPWLFLQLAKPDEEGFSRPISVKRFKGPRYAKLQIRNGGDWCRSDGTLASSFNVLRHKDKKGAIESVELHGFSKLPRTPPIPKKIKDRISKQRCVVLHTSNVQVDHKDGRKDDRRLADPTKVSEDDFQPLSRAANVAKRQHCLRCKDTDKRFDATVLGFAKAQIHGNGKYKGTCQGCYWHDPKGFAAYFKAPRKRN